MVGRDHGVLLDFTKTWSPKGTGKSPRWLSPCMWGPVVAVLDEWGPPRDLENNDP